MSRCALSPTALAVFLCVTAPGCGPIVAAILLTLPKGSAGPTFVAAPTLAFSPIGREVASPVSLSVTVGDQQGADVALTGFDLDKGDGSGFASKATITSPALPVTVATATSGATVNLVWDAQADLGTSAHKNIRLQARFALTGANASREFTQPMTPAEAFTYGNDAPAVQAVTVFGSAGNVVVKYQLSDSTGDTTSVKATFSSPDLPGGPRPITALVAGSTSGLLLPGSGASAPFDFTWDTSAEPGVTSATLTSVVVTLTPVDSFGATGAATSSAPFTIDNNARPVVFVTEPVANPDTNGAIAVSFTLRDAERDKTDVIIQWSTSPGTFPPIDDLLADPSLRRRTLLDPDARAPRRIVTPRLLPQLEARCFIPTPAPPADQVVLAELAMPVALSRRLVGATLELLSDGGAVEQTQTIASVDPKKGRLHLAAPLTPPPRQGQRVRVVETISRLFLGLGSSPLGTSYRFAWDAPADVGTSYGRGTEYFRLS